MLAAPGKPEQRSAGSKTIVLSSDGKEYVHAHPADDESAKGNNVVAFQAHFMKAGLYKGWGQFHWRDEVRVVPFVVKIE